MTREHIEPMVCGVDCQQSSSAYSIAVNRENIRSDSPDGERSITKTEMQQPIQRARSYAYPDLSLAHIDLALVEAKYNLTRRTDVDESCVCGYGIEPSRISLPATKEGGWNPWIAYDRWRRRQLRPREERKL